MVLDRLDETRPGAEVEAAVLAALEEDDAAFHQVLSRPLAEAGTRRPRGSGRDPAPAAPSAYLRRLTVAGFRGIGAPATLDLEPGPGLTVVAGRNGSGKSSFAEALEVLMTGTLKRWDSRSADWKETWRCLHASTAEITAELLVEGVDGPTTLRRAWDLGATKLADACTSVQPHGQPRTDLEAWGWDRAVEAQRPFLSHAELEALLAQPKALHDQLNDLLGLEDLDAAAARLGASRLAADKVIKRPRQEVDGLRERLQGSDDSRAAKADALLAKRTPDIDELGALGVGTAVPDDGPLDVLGQIGAITGPDGEAVGKAIALLRDAVAVLASATSGLAREAIGSVTLLRAALAHTNSQDSDECPVCGTQGVIDGEWRTRTEDRLRRLDEDTIAWAAAEQQVADALRQARTLVDAAPVELHAAGDVGIDSAPLLAAWSAWAAMPSGDTPAAATELANHLESTVGPLIDALSAVRTAVDAQRRNRQDLWAPLATAIVEWCELQRAALGARETYDLAKKAEHWLKSANESLRNDRLQPFAEQTVAFWNDLRQASNVDLRELRLVGSGNRARVDFRVTVDGADATGLGVMSQGEANALALSVFLPRAMLPGSPFRFLVIDDPIQAMDPSKVDGLARVLVQVAERHQVVVFTHDDRLPESLRRLALPGTVVQVSRAGNSHVHVDAGSDPFERLLRDAGQVIGHDKVRNRVPAAVAGRVVPGICRTALESLLNELIRNRELSHGANHEAVEAGIDGAHRLTERLALAVWGDAGRHGEVSGWLANQVGPWARDLVRTLNKGAHGDDIGALDLLVSNTRRLGGNLRRRLT